MPLRIRNVELMAKIESAYGVDPVLAAAADAVIARNISISYPNDIVDRNGVAGSLSPLAPQLARNHAVLSFETEVKASGVAVDTPPDWGPLLRACGFTETVNASTDVTYTPRSSGFESITLEYYLDGLMYQLLGARGNVVFNFAVGAIATMSFTFTGKYQAPTDVALPGGTYQAAVPAPLKNVGLQVGSFAPVLASWSIDMANEVNLGDDLNGADGYSTVEIMDRAPLGTIDPETTLVAGNDWWADWIAGTARAIDLQAGTVATNIVTVTAPACVHRDIQDGDRNSRAILTIPHTLSKVLDAGDDEISIVLT